MPKQPKVRSNDPNRRKSYKGGAFSALASMSQGPDDVQQYSSAGPQLIKNNTTADNLVVGKTFGGPTGTSVWSELSQLLGAGMQAATTGAQIYGQITQQREKADREADKLAQQEYEEKAAQLELDIQGMDEVAQHAERGKLLSTFEDRFVTDEGRHRHNLAGLKHELGTSHADATAWVRTNVTDKVSQARLTFSKDPEKLAEKISEIYETASDVIMERHGKDSQLYSKYMQMIASGVQSADSLVKNTAREMVFENRDAIASARTRIVERMSQGEDVLGGMGLDDSSTLGAYAAAIFEEAGLDLTQLDPEQASAVQIEFRDMMLKDLKDDMKALQDADDDRIQKRAKNLLDAELAEWDADRDFTMNEDSIDTLMAARQRFAQTDPGREKQAAVDEGIISKFIEGSVVRLNINMSDKDRKEFVEQQVSMMLDQFGHNNDDPISRRVRARAASMINRTDFNVLRKHLEKKDHMALFKVGAYGTGPEADLAYKLAMEQMGITMSDYFGQEAIMLFDQYRRDVDSDPSMAALATKTGNNAYRMSEDQADKAKNALGFAFREAVTNRGNFEEVLKAELESQGLGDRFESVMSSVASSKSGQLLHILDQERNDNVGKPQTVREVTDLYKSLGGTVTDGGNLEGGMAMQTDAVRMKQALRKSSGSRQIGATVSEAMPNKPDAMNTALYEQDVNSFVGNLLAVPGFVAAYQAEGDANARVTMLNNAFSARYYTAPPAAALGMLDDFIKKGGFENDDAVTIVSQIGTMFAQDMSQARNKMVTENRNFDGKWNGISLDIKASIARYVPSGIIDENTAAGWASSKGLLIARNSETNEITIEVDPARSSNDLLMSLGETVEGEVSGGSAMASAQYNVEAKKAMTTYAAQTENLLATSRDHLANPGDVEAMQMFIEGLVTKPGMALNMTAAAFGLEGEAASTFEKLRNAIRGKRSSHTTTNNIEHGRLALASALIYEGIPIEEWNLDTFEIVGKDTENQYMRRARDGTLSFTIPGEANEPPMTLIVPPAFSGAYGAGVTRNNQSAVTGRAPNKVLGVKPEASFYMFKNRVDEDQRELRDTLKGEELKNHPRYIEEWTGNERMDEETKQHPFFDIYFPNAGDDKFAY